MLMYDSLAHEVEDGEFVLRVDEVLALDQHRPKQTNRSERE